MSEFILLFLGTSASIPSPIRSLPAILLKHQRQRFLVDCGEGTQLRLMQAGESLKIPHILLTHDHLDHILGLGGLLFSLSLCRMKPTPHITIYGGGTTLDRARTLASWIRSSRAGKAHVEIDYTEVMPGHVFQNDQLAVTAFPTNHRERPCYGYAFQSKGKQPAKVVFTGDTGYMDSLVDVATDADCLISEANFGSDRIETAAKVGHLTTVQAAEIAREAGVKCLMLNHVSRAYGDGLEDVLAEAQAIFPNTLLPSDLDCFQINCDGVRHAT